MYTKSKIQMIKEEFAKASGFESELNMLMDKYTIEDSVFVYRDNTLLESTQGYFECLKEYSSLSEAVKACFNHYDIMGVRVINNDRFMAGRICKSITECNRENKIFDIDRLSDVN